MKSLSPRIDSLIAALIAREGGFVDRADDSGGPTNWGITLATLSMDLGRPATIDELRALTADQAKWIYMRRYVIRPHFNDVMALSAPIADELVDTGVNMGIERAATFLQTALNVFNKGGTLYGDIAVDGAVGAATLAALRAYLNARGTVGEQVMLKALNCQQGAAYILLAQMHEKDEAFVFGWLRARVVIGAAA